jgi:hypothetical protein
MMKNRYIKVIYLKHVIINDLRGFSLEKDQLDNLAKIFLLLTSKTRRTVFIAKKDEK